MKNTMRCPKCQSQDIVLVAGNRETGGAGNLISLSRWSIFALVKPVLRIMAGRGVWMGGNIFQVDNLLNARPELGRELINFGLVTFLVRPRWPRRISTS